MHQFAEFVLFYIKLGILVAFAYRIANLIENSIDSKPVRFLLPTALRLVVTLSPVLWISDYFFDNHTAVGIAAIPTLAFGWVFYVLLEGHAIRFYGFIAARTNKDSSEGE